MTTPPTSLTTEPTATADQLRGVLRRPAFRVVLAALAAGLLSAGSTPSATAAETCPNATLREQNNSTELPECRAYEMVSSPYKQGFEAFPQSFSDDGIVTYTSTGSFAGNGTGEVNNNYQGVRTPEGWETRSLEAAQGVLEVQASYPFVFARDLRSSIAAWKPVSDPAGDGQGLYVRDFDGTFTRVGTGPVPTSPGFQGLQVFKVSDDLSHVIFGQITWGGLEYVGVGAAALLRHENVDNSGATLPGEPAFNAISGDGRVAVFSAGGVWARIGDSATVAVSGSQCTRGPLDPGGACNGTSPAKYAGSAADGSRVFVTTTQQLVNGDTDQTNDLYECDIPPGAPAPIGTANPCASLTELSGAANGANAQNVVAVSEDGSRVYFMAEGAVLADNPGANDETAVAGNHNLYVWTKDAAHPEGQTTFVAPIDGNGITGAQTTADGRYLVFSTTSALVSSGPGADTDTRADIYRYDAESRAMQRISTSVTGSGGNNPEVDTFSRSSQRGSVPADVSADGSTIVFETAEALSPQDTDGVTDVYLWHDGHVSLVSHDGGQEPSIDASGQNIYFVTEQPLTAADRDANADIYDARVDGGFDLNTPPSCSGEACQGQPNTPPAVAGTPGSETLTAAGSPPPQPAIVATTKSKPLTRQQKLAKTLKLCRKKPKHKRLACERQARKRYAPPSKSARRSHR